MSFEFSILITSLIRVHSQNKPIKLTAAANSNIALPAKWASSWLSLISMFIMCTGWLNSPPRVNRSVKSLSGIFVRSDVGTDRHKQRQNIAPRKL